MPSSDYTAAIGGGLRLKGAKDAGVSKKKHKKKAKPAETREDQDADKAGDAQATLQKALADEEQDAQTAKPEDKDVKEYGKTEAQRRFDERRKQRLDERLKREGVLTHKERVEQLNKYLSKLSEHHDMPRIGPG